MPKSKDAFRTISEVADWLDVQPHVLRFWESKFSQVRPVKRAGGRRYYRPADMLLIGGIKQLLHDDGMTIKGVQKLLREKGAKEISALSRPIDGDSDITVELNDPAQVTEADLIGEDTSTTEAPAQQQTPAQVEPEEDKIDTLAVASAAPQADPAPASTGQTEADARKTIPQKPQNNDLQSWRLRRRILARLTEITELEPESKGEIATALDALAKLKSNRQTASRA